MATRWTAVPVGLVLSALTLLAAADPKPTPPGADEWKYDVVYLKSGASFKGLLLERNEQRILIKCIRRTPGKLTTVIEENIETEKVDRLVLLDPQERERLKKRLEAIRNEYLRLETLKAKLKRLDPGTRPEQPAPVDAVVLKPAPWPHDPKAMALAYESAHFHLISDSREDVVQLAAVHLEQIYAAYASCLPPRNASAQPTTILLVRSLPEYQRLLQGRGLNFFNQALYDLEKNEVVCGSDLQRLSDDLEKSRALHAKLLAELKERKAELKAAYKGNVPPEFLTPIVEGQERIKRTDFLNTESFKMARDRLFQRLYHEAFHAYLNNWVYPPSEFQVPLWLNEGLAQIFETAKFELGELRVGPADENRWKAMRKATGRDNTLLPLTVLLRSTPAQFQVAHRSDQQISDAYYLASWGLAHYLTFDRKMLGRKAMDDYVRELKRPGADPLAAFQDLVGKPLPDFEKEYLRYLNSLQLDGTSPRTKE